MNGRVLGKTNIEMAVKFRESVHILVQKIYVINSWRSKMDKLSVNANWHPLA